RIVPLYVLVLTVLLFMLPALGQSTPTLDKDREHQVWLWLYLTNWDPYFAHGRSVVNHFWSLAVEEQFYLLWPFLVRRVTPDRLLPACVAIAVGSLAWRVVQVGQGTDPELIYVSTLARFDALALGAAVAAVAGVPRVWQQAVAHRRWIWPIVGGLSVLGVFATAGIYPRTSPLGQVVGYGWLSVTFALALLAAVTWERGSSGPSKTWGQRLLTWRPLTRIGKFSYGIYLIHKPLHDLVVKPWWVSHGIKPTQSILTATLALLAETLVYVALAALLYRFFERRFLDLR
ncbi:MAG: acyltransferase family protein, partial [Methylibium sp.]